MSNVDDTAKPVAGGTMEKTDSHFHASGKNRLGLYLTLPAQILVLFIALFPLLMQLYISLTDWTPLTGVRWPQAYQLWSGLANYADLLDDDRFYGALWRTFFIIIVAVPIEFFLGLAMALLFIDEFPAKRLFYSALLVPMMIVPAVAGYMFFLLFQSGGPINQLLSLALGTTVAISWLSDPDLALAAVIISDIWQWTPLMFLILLAGLLGVPSEQLKAATLLGASPWQRFLTILLPKIKAIMVIALAIRTIELFKIFDTLYIMTAGGPGVATETISVFIFKITTQELVWGYVAALALLILFTLSVIAGLAMYFLQRKKREVAA